MPKLIPRFLIVSAISLCFTATNAQNNPQLDSLKEKYRHEALRLQRGSIVKGENGVAIPYHEWQDQFSMSPQALDEFKLYERQRKLSKITRFLGYACLGAAAFLLHDNNNRTVALEVITGGFVITNFISLPISRNANRLLEHAIWQRNMDLLFPNREH